MKLKIDRTNKNWCKSMSDEDIYNIEVELLDYITFLFNLKK